MKYLLLLLFTFNAYANFRLRIIPTDTKYASRSLTCADQSDCDSKLKSFVKRTSLKGEWKSDALGSIVSETYIDEEMQEQTRYFHPTNFSVNQVDMSAEIAEKLSKKARLDFLKNKNKASNDKLNLKELIEILELKGIL